MTHSEFAAYDAVPDAVVAVGHDGSILFANVYAERLFRYGPGELVGLEVEALIPDRFRRRHAQLLAGYFSEADARPMGMGREIFALRSDGQEFPVELALGPTDNGKATVAVIRDISAIVKTRDKLRHSEAESHDLEQSFRDASIGLCHFDKELRYLRVNKWLARINGLSVEEHVGRKIADVLPHVALGVEGQLRQVLETGEPIVGGLVETTTPAHPTTTRTYMHNYLPDRSANGAVVGISCVVQDVTEARKGLKRALAEIKELRDRLQAENIYFQEEIKSSHDFEEIIGNSETMMTALYQTEQVADTGASVLLLGETGTGKELFARAIHARSRRKEHPLIKVDCTTLPPGLVESTLFGHVKGAFTGAHRTNPGRFELADGGTIFLDEIGELSLELQTKLLRVLQEGEFEPVGSVQTRKVDVRIIAATNRDLQSEMRSGRFRSDLFHRLGVFPIEIPPLRERREDIPLLASFLLAKSSARIGKRILSIPQKAMDALVSYEWPGNVRELQNVIERSVILSPGDELRVGESLGRARATPGRSAPSLRQDLKEIERDRIRRVLDACNWRIKGDGHAADRLGLRPSTLRSRMQRLEIKRP